jgi:hypothetical protein
MSSFNPSKSIASFDAQKLHRLAEFHPNDIKGIKFLKLELQLDSQVDDKRQDCFKEVRNLVDLSVSLLKQRVIQCMRYGLYLLLNFVLIPPVATPSAERVFSAFVLVVLLYVVRFLKKSADDHEFMISNNPSAGAS